MHEGKNQASHSDQASGIAKERGKERLLRLLLIVSLVPFIALGGFAYYGYHKVLQEGNHDFMKSAVESRHIIIEQFLFERLAKLKEFSRSHDLNDLSSSDHLQEDLRNWRSIYEDYQLIELYDAKGKQIMAASIHQEASEHPATATAKEEEWFQKTLEEGEFVSNFYQIQDEPVLSLSVAVNHNGKEWVLRTVLAVERLYELLQELKVGTGGGTYMVNPFTGTYLSRPYFGKQALKDINPYFNLGGKHYHSDYEHHGVEEVLVSNYTNPAGEKVLEAHCCILNGTWLIVLERKTSDISIEWSSFPVWGLFAVFAGGMIFIIGGVIYGTNQWAKHRETG